MTAFPDDEDESIKTWPLVSHCHVLPIAVATCSSSTSGCAFVSLRPTLARRALLNRCLMPLYADIENSPPTSAGNQAGDDEGNIFRAITMRISDRADGWSGGGADGGPRCGGRHRRNCGSQHPRHRGHRGDPQRAPGK